MGYILTLTHYRLFRYDVMEKQLKHISAKYLLKLAGLFLFLLFFSNAAKLSAQQQNYNYDTVNRLTKRVHKKAIKFARNCITKADPLKISKYLRLDSVLVDEQNQIIDLYYNWNLGEQPFREDNVQLVYDTMQKLFGWRFRNYRFRIYSKKFLIEDLIPNYYRSDPNGWDQLRLGLDDGIRIPVVRNISRAWQPEKGLYQRNIALWHSHGWYYEHKEKRWKWQRARLFQTVEDLFTMAFTVPYLIPMLENAGANVFLPRERDFQTHEVIVDFESADRDSISYFESVSDSSVSFQPGSDSSGFAVGSPPYSSGENPFKAGSYRYILTDSVETARTEYIPNIPENGRYAVYVSYVTLDYSITDAHYTVFHTGGQTDFLVNQQIGGGTWIYLGTFQFKAGSNPDIGKVILCNQSQRRDGIVTADAVRFGGGMGNIAREGQISDRPRFTEAARYYLQYAGFPDTLIYDLNNDSSDYIDDFQCRGEWVNYLKGTPFGPNKNRDIKGLGIPIDLSLAFHTDAGKAARDSVVGTLSIYNTDGADSSYQFPNGQSRLANRDLADIVQTQIVEDIQAKYQISWNRRTLADRSYSEAWRPNVPAMLLELLSHQNFQDMKFGNDPQFRFDVSRSIYKALLRFVSSRYQLEYIVQPLPVTHFQAILNSDTSVTLRWQPTLDSLEPSADADQYIVYTRIEDNGFDNGMLVNGESIIISDLKLGIIYSYKVTAVNAGGESFPSEILSVCCCDSLDQPVLIVNGFDRVAAPASIDIEPFRGFAAFQDQGEPDGYDLNYTGDQYDFWETSPFLEDESPGHGASHADYETKIIAGNTRDFVYLHGQSVKAAGLGFASASDEAIMDGQLDLRSYSMVDIIMGEEKLTEGPTAQSEKQFQVFPRSLQRKISEFCEAGGNLFISGAYIGSDPYVFTKQDTQSVRFVENCLKYRWQTNYAARTGNVIPVDTLVLPMENGFRFNTELNASIYAVEAPDAIIPADTSSLTVLRYSENNTSAAVGFVGEYRVLAFGFPFETILDQRDRDQVMNAILTFFKVKK